MHGTRDLPYKTIECRHGTFSYHDTDELVGLALEQYGEYSEAEVELFRNILRPGMVAVDVGANIGAFTIPMAKYVGEAGKVYAIEASAPNVKLLSLNAKQNDLNNIEIVPYAASDTIGSIEVTKQDALHAYSRPDLNVGTFDIPTITIDSLNLERCDLIKVDVDRFEIQVIKGARETIKRCRPIIYIENEHDDLKTALIAEIIDLGYRMYWHKPFQYNQDNWRGNKRNLFANIVSIMNVCIPDESKIEAINAEEVMDYRNDDRMFDREIMRCRKRLENDYDSLDTRLSLAYHLALMQQVDEARALLDENLRQEPNHTPSISTRAILDLQAGDYRKGWPGFEMRFAKDAKNLMQFGGDRLYRFTCPMWDGKPTDEPMLIWTEQGFGDNIMCARFMKQVLELAPNAFLECRPELYELFEYSEVVPQGLLYRFGRTLPEFTRHCSLPSTMAKLNIDEHTIDPAPYLKADPALTANWRGEGHVRIGQMVDPMCGARIGFCYKGSPNSERPFTRDIPPHLLVPLSDKYGPFFPLEQQGQFESFMTSAAAVSALDLIITVDTSMAHLAGALGVPTWLLLSTDPDWRWGLTGETTPWYGSMKIFRQTKFRDWQSVLDRVAIELEKRNADIRS